MLLTPGQQHSLAQLLPRKLARNRMPLPLGVEMPSQTLASLWPDINLLEQPASLFVTYFGSDEDDGGGIL